MVADLVVVVNVRDVVGGGCLTVVVGDAVVVSVKDMVWKAATKKEDVAAKEEDAVAVGGVEESGRWSTKVRWERGGRRC